MCPQGGNTSVLGGSVPVFDEVIISTELMNEIVDLDEHSGESEILRKSSIFGTVFCRCYNLSSWMYFREY